MFNSLKFLNEGFDRRYLKEEVDEELFHNDNGTDYVVVERSKSGKNALLRTQNGKKWIVAWDCPKSNEGSWGQGHYFFDEHEARDLWEKKYLNEDVRREWKPNTSFKHIKDVYNKVKANNYKYVNNEREEMNAAVDAADKGKYTPEQRRQIKEWHREIWSAHRSKTNEDWNIEDQIDAPESIGKLNKGDKFKNRKGTVITITDPAKDGKIQYCVGDECRSGSEKSIQQMLYRNNYVRVGKKKKTNEAIDDHGVERYGVNGKWWYFTTHGVQPGSVPKGIQILDVKEGKNKKGTRGTFFASDRVLNTSELDRYDIKEEVPVNESLKEANKSKPDEKSKALDAARKIVDIILNIGTSSTSEKRKIESDIAKILGSCPVGTAIKMTAKGSKSVQFVSKISPSNNGGNKREILLYDIDSGSPHLKSSFKPSAAARSMMSYLESGYTPSPDYTDRFSKSKREVPVKESIMESLDSDFEVDIYEVDDELDLTNKVATIPVSMSELKRRLGNHFDNAIESVTQEHIEAAGGIDPQWTIGNVLNSMAHNKFMDSSKFDSSKYYSAGPVIRVNNLGLFPKGIELSQKKLGKLLLPTVGYYNKRTNESLTEDTDGSDYLKELKEKQKYISDKLEEIRRNHHYRGYTSDYMYKSYLKQLAQVEKQIAKIEASANNEEVLTTAKVTNAIKKVSGLETLKTMTTSIRGYRPVTGGSFRVEPSYDCFDVYFYKNYDKIPEIVTELKKLGFIISHQTDKSITIKKNRSLNPVDELLNEDTVKQNGKWVNKGKEGTHGKFATKKAADAQRKAMFANGYKAESLNEDYDKYGLRYVVAVGKSGNVTTKQKFFKTEKARDRFIDNLVDNNPNFIRIEAVSDPWEMMGEALNEASKLDIINLNKKHYQQELDRISSMKDGLEKDVASVLILDWIKGNNWLGGMPDRRFDTLATKLIKSKGYSMDEIYDEFNRRIMGKEFQESLNEDLLISPNKEYQSKSGHKMNRLEELGCNDGWYNESINLGGGMKLPLQEGELVGKIKIEGGKYADDYMDILNELKHYGYILNTYDSMNDIFSVWTYGDHQSATPEQLYQIGYRFL